MDKGGVHGCLHLNPTSLSQLRFTAMFRVWKVGNEAEIFRSCCQSCGFEKTFSDLGVNQASQAQNCLRRICRRVVSYYISNAHVKSTRLFSYSNCAVEHSTGVHSSSYLPLSIRIPRSIRPLIVLLEPLFGRSIHFLSYIGEPALNTTPKIHTPVPKCNVDYYNLYFRRPARL
ncbi:hypothetical protein PLICRDRAFT_530864 [Plicaturopsis crispa FD-325 SS-3]|nr:hypothetical protein PLICRDRAFT_530864 [Plicaturopsis crispa FD-325 SS-3]